MLYGEIPQLMLKIFYSPDFGVNWTDVDPTNTTFGKGESFQISTDNSGLYVYATWIEDTTNNTKIFYSSDNGVNWTDVDPTNTTFGLGVDPQIITDSTGKYVYNIWQTHTTTYIKVFYSSDFGVNWAQATTDAFLINKPQITTNSTGKYVYATWRETVTDNIKIVYSSDFGNNFTDVDPTNTTFGDGSLLQIITDNSGSFVYAIWEDLSNNIKIFHSSNNGVSWSAASGSLGIGHSSQITTDDSGRYVYAIWEDATTSGNVKIFYSLDFGNNFTDADPSNSILGKGNLDNAQITTDDIGKNIYGTWTAISTGFTVITRGIKEADSRSFPVVQLGILR